MKNTKKRNNNNWLKLSLNRKIFFVAVLCLFASGVVAILIPSQPNNYIVNESQAAGTQNPDINNSGQVDVFDLSMLLASWGTAGVGSGDLNGDGTVNVFDLSMLLSNWGPYTPTVVRPNETNTGPKTSQFSLITEKYPSLNGSAYTVNSIGRVTIKGNGTASNYLTFDGVYFPHGALITGNYIKITNSKIAAGRSTASLPRNPMNETECKAYSGSGWALFTSRSSEITTNPQLSLIVEDSEIYIRNNKTRTMDGSTNDGNITETIGGRTYNYTNDGPSVGMNAFQGRNATFRRVNVHGGIDGLGFNPRGAGETAGGVVLEDSYVHDLFRWPYSPGHNCRDKYLRNSDGSIKLNTNGNPILANNPYSTHSDGIQIHGIGDFVIRSNNIVANPLTLDVEVQESANASTLTGVYDKYITSTRVGTDGKKYVRWVPKNNTGIESNGNGQKVTITNNHFEYGTCSINMASGINAASSVTKNTFWGKNGSFADQFGTRSACAINVNGLPVPTTGDSINKWSDGTTVLPTS